MNIAVPIEASASKIKLSRKAIEIVVASHPLGERGRYWFEDHPGLYLSISKRGRATYYVRYRKLSGQKGDFAIGRANVLTPQEARDKARDTLADLALNYRDPVEARRTAVRHAQAAPTRTFRALKDDFLAAAEIKALAPRTLQEWEWVLDKYVLPELGDLEASTIKRRDVKECLRAIQTAASQRVAEHPKAGNRTANQAHGVVRRIFNWAIDEERLENNPASFKAIFDDTPTKRIGALDEDRIRAIWEAIEQDLGEGWSVGSLIAIQLAFVTLSRPNEICNARLEQFDWERGIWRLPERYTKTNTVYEVPLSDTAAFLFKRAFAESQSEWAFVAKDGKSRLRPTVLSHRFAKLRKRLVKTGSLPTPSIVLYDARRFGRTYIEHTLGFQDHIAEAVINHAGDKSMKRRYDVGDHSGAIRKAHEAWDKALHAIVSGSSLPENVVQFAAR